MRSTQKLERGIRTCPDPAALNREACALTHDLGLEGTDKLPRFLRGKVRFCPKCGAAVPRASGEIIVVYCEDCGAVLPGDYQGALKVSKWSAPTAWSIPIGPPYHPGRDPAGDTSGSSSDGGSGER